MPAVPLLAGCELPIPPSAARVLEAGARSGRLTHLEQVQAAAGQRVDWPDWAPPQVTKAFENVGVPAPWAHQAAAADHAAAGRNVIISTSPASGKSLGYLLPALTQVLDGGTALYLAPTRALAADQLRMVSSLDIPGVRPAVMDGDTPAPDRAWARAHATYLLTTPDMLHHSLLPRHARWDGFFRRLKFVIVDECHTYRGVFGSHVAQVLRRLRRITAHHAAFRGERTGPVFVLASATISEPETCARLLTGLDAVAVTADSAPRGPLTFGLWEPPLTALRGEAGAPVRRTATAEAAGMLADLVLGGVPALAFVRSRRGAEAIALGARRSLAEAGAADLEPRVAAYRSGYLPEDRRAIEEAVLAGRITGLAATPALELGVNIGGLDAVLVAGWPGTRAALWQQAGRAGREGRGAVAILIARDDPLDTYLVHHPEALLQPAGRGHRARSGQPVRAGPAPVRGRRGTVADRRGHRPVRRGRGGRRGRPEPPGDAAAQEDPGRNQVVLDAQRPDRDDRPARDRGPGRCASWRPRPAGWSAPWTSRPRTCWRTPARSTRIRARCTW